MPVINNIIINGSFNLNEQDIHYQNLVAFGLIWAVLLPKWPNYDEESDSQFQIFQHAEYRSGARNFSCAEL